LHTPISYLLFFFFLLIPPPPSSTLFPYTTLFRSDADAASRAMRDIDPAPVERRPLRPPDSRDDSAAEGGRRSIGLGESDLASLRSEEHTSELQSRRDLVCRLLLEKKKKKRKRLTN